MSKHPSAPPAPAPDTPAKAAGQPELLPCPFCGGRPTWHEVFLTGDEFVGCDACEVFTPPKATAEEAAAAWNRRTAGALGVSSVPPPNDDAGGLLVRCWAAKRDGAFANMDGVPFLYRDRDYAQDLADEDGPGWTAVPVEVRELTAPAGVVAGVPAAARPSLYERLKAQPAWAEADKALAELQRANSDAVPAAARQPEGGKAK